MQRKKHSDISSLRRSSMLLIGMKGVTLEKIIAFLKLDLKFACCWPLPQNATKQQILHDRIFRLLSSLHAILLIVEFSYTIIYHVENVIMFMQAICGVGLMFEVPLQIMLYTLQHDRLQTVIAQVEDYYQRAKPQERDIFQKYVDKCTYFYTMTLCIMTASPISAILEPLFYGANSYPFLIKYPFVVNQPLQSIIYFHHSFGIYQLYCQICSNNFVALLLWFTSARFEILYNKFRNASKYSDWQICVREYQELLRFAEDITLSISYVVLSSLSISTFALVFSGVSILSRLPLFVKIKFIVVCLSSLMKVFLCTWPADHLINISSDIGKAAYNSLWYVHGINSQRIMLYTLLRCQRPVIVTVPGLLTALSFQHYASYISTAFSFLTTFRIILSEDESR